MKKSVIVFLFCLLIPFSVDARSDSLVMKLQFKPRHIVNVRPKNIPAARIFFEPVNDVRSNPRRVGVNVEHRNERIPVFSSDSGAASRFVHSALIKEFRNKRFLVENQSDAAPRIITATILKFWTEETSNYSSQTQLRIEVKDKSGLLYHSGTYTGFGRNKGRSLYDVNYSECMSDAMTSLIDKLFSDQGFLSALSGSSRPSPVK